MENKDYFENVDIFDSIDASSETLDFLEKKGSNLDGIYRPKITDKKKGYTSTIRFLPNLTQEGKVGPSAIEKHQHYVDLKNHPELMGYYDCMKNFSDKCDICTMYWKMKNSKNQAEVEKAELISRNTKYYSYILVIEDEQNPDLEGKILVYPYGYKIKEKIKDERDGVNSSKTPSNIFDLANGKDFNLVIKQVGDYPNYDSSLFLNESPIKIMGRKAPTTVDKDGKPVINPDARKKILGFLKDRQVEVEDHKAKEWTDDDKFRVTQVLEILVGNDITIAERATTQDSSDNVGDDVFESEDVDSAEDFFNLPENE